jgi:hypothetical protein
MSTRQEALVKVYMQTNVIILLVVSLILLAGCSDPVIRHQDFYSLSKRYTPESTKDFERGKTMAKGSHSGPVVFFVPFGIKSPKVAMDDAIKNYHKPAIALEDITIYPHTPFMFGAHGYFVHATAILEP